MPLIKSFLFFCTLFMLAGTAQAAKSRDLLEQFLNATNTLQADFRQRLLDPGGVLMQESAGQFSLKRPGKFSWDYKQPYAQQIVSNGQKIWIYDSELEQVSVKPYSDVLSGAPVILLDQRRDLDQEFVVEDKGQVDDQYWVSLTPRKDDNEFKNIRVGMDDKQLRTIMLVDAFEQTTIIEFEHLKINPPLADEQFEFSPPPGTDVVGDF